MLLIRINVTCDDKDSFKEIMDEALKKIMESGDNLIHQELCLGGMCNIDIIGKSIARYRICRNGVMVGAEGSGEHYRGDEWLRHIDAFRAARDGDVIVGYDSDDNECDRFGTVMKLEEGSNKP